VCPVTRGAHIVSLCALSPVVHTSYRCVPCHPWCTHLIAVCPVTRGAHIVSLCALSPVVHTSYRCVPCHPWCTHRIVVCPVTSGAHIVSLCAVSPVVHTSNISSCQENFFSFPVAVNNSIKIGPLVFLL